jgi:hypothetical protein
MDDTWRLILTKEASLPNAIPKHDGRVNWPIPLLLDGSVAALHGYEF